MWTLLGLLAFAAIVWEPSRRRIDEALKVLMTGKSSAQEATERKKSERDLLVDELKIAAIEAGVSVKDGVLENAADALVARNEKREANK